MLILFSVGHGARMFDMAGDDSVQFGLGEPDFQPPDLAIDAFEKAMREGRNKYTTTAGLPELRNQCLYYNEWNKCITGYFPRASRPG